MSFFLQFFGFNTLFQVFSRCMRVCFLIIINGFYFFLWLEANIWKRYILFIRHWFPNFSGCYQYQLSIVIIVRDRYTIHWSYWLRYSAHFIHVLRNVLPWKTSFSNKKKISGVPSFLARPMPCSCGQEIESAIIIFNIDINFVLISTLIKLQSRF